MSSNPGDPIDSPDSATVDLSPRVPRVAQRSRSKWPAVTVVVILAAVVVGLIWFLVSNSTSFEEADAAVEKRDELGDQRFQLLGSPLDNTVDITLDGNEAVAFTVQFDGVLVDVVNIGSPAAQFQAAVPVVLEGNWVQGDAPIDRFEGGANDGWYFRLSLIHI